MTALQATTPRPAVDPAAVPRLRSRAVRRGERWIFSAGFNVRPDLRETSRIDSELDDIRHIADAGGRVAILSHHGNHGDHTALHLDFVAGYLSECLGRPVRYVPVNAGEQAEAEARSLRDGDVAVFGNTRHHGGEEANDPELAKAFSRLGEVVAVGGFSKAHRAHASNVGILAHLPGVLAGSVDRELDVLTPWAGDDPAVFSVAVLGGRKREKTCVALAGFCRTYDLVIPGGAVLNNLLQVRGYGVGASHLGAAPDATLAAAERVLSGRKKAEIHIPRQLIVATVSDAGYRKARTVSLGDPIGDGESIVDFVLDDSALAKLAHLVAARGRLLIAGTPALYTLGFGTAVDPIIAAARALPGNTILLGGDTTAELPFGGTKSPGGGSALQYVCDGTLPILTALATQPHTAGAPA